MIDEFNNLGIGERRRLCSLLNQLFEVDRKLENGGEDEGLRRCVQKMKDLIAEWNIEFYNPLDERCPDTRTDVEVHLAGDRDDNLRIVQVIKPIIRSRINGVSKIVQKGIVVVESYPEDQTSGQQD